jgi:hypothetical protein
MHLCEFRWLRELRVCGYPMGYRTAETAFEVEA